MIIRKYASGGDWAVFLSPSKASTSTPYTSIFSSTKKKKTEESESTSGELTEKAFYDMIKGIDALPNDLDKITGKILGMLKLNELTGIDTFNLELRYIEILHDITRAKRNKELFDEAYKNARTDLSLNEIAILPGGLVAVFDTSQNKFDSVPVNTFLENVQEKGPLRAMTVSDLAFFRAYDPKFIESNTLFNNPDEIFNIMNSNMSTKKFQELLDQAKISLGNTETTTGNVLLLQAKIGLELIKNMSQNLISNLLDEISSGTYGQDSIKKRDNTDAVAAYSAYLLLVLPEEAKVWALLKTCITNPNDAAAKLIKMYMQGQINTLTDSSISFHNTSGSSKGSTSNDYLAAEDAINSLNAGFWQLLYRGTSGNSTTVQFLSGKTEMTVGGRYYRTLPKIEGQMSLYNYSRLSGLDLVTANKNIMFGSFILDDTAVDDILVDDRKGVMVLTLPVNLDGSIKFDLLKEYEDITTKLINDGYTYGTEEYERELGKELSNNSNFKDLIDQSTGLPSRMDFKRFIVLSGYATENAKVKVGNDVDDIYNAISKQDELAKALAKAQGSNTGDTPETWVRENKDKKTIEDVENGLSTKDYKYKISKHSMFGGKTVYIGNIFIPFTEESLNAGLADENIPTVGESQAIYGYEEQLDRTRLKVKDVNPGGSKLNKQ